MSSYAQMQTFRELMHALRPPPRLHAQLGMDSNNPGARMLTRMGFGALGTGLGRQQQGISAPIQPVAVTVRRISFRPTRLLGGLSWRLPCILCLHALRGQSLSPSSHCLLAAAPQKPRCPFFICL